MSNKRNASTDLNHDNWNDEEEPETSGSFQAAQPSVIASRLIKQATRRLNNSSDDASDTSKEERPEVTPSSSETVFRRLGVNFASSLQDKKKTTFFNSRMGTFRPRPIASNTNQDLSNASQPESPLETQSIENKYSTQDNVTTDEESPGTSAFRRVNPSNSPSTSRFGLTTACGLKSLEDPTTVKKPRVSSNNNTWQRLTGITPAQSMNEASAPSFMPCLETRPVVESQSGAPSTDTEILGQNDSRHLLKPVPDEVLARLMAKSEATAKSLNFLKRTYQLNMTTLDWLHILIKESLTVNIAEVIPSYMHELVKLIEEEIACQESSEEKQQLIPHKNRLQQMLGIFRQFGFLSEEESVSKSATLPESANKASTSKSPLITNNLESASQSSNSPVTHNDTTWKIKSTNQEMQQNLQTNVQSESLAVASSENHGNPQQESEQTEDDDESSKSDSYTPVVEEGSICTMRCKVFVKKVLDPSDPFDTPYQNRGVGSLFIKPIARGKLQLVIRADNSLGNIILNTCITPEIPIEILNSNTLMLVCCPMPGDIARTVLIRVKNKLHVDLLHIHLVPAPN